MKSAVVVFPGSNCDRDAATALEQLSGQKTYMAWHQDTALPDVDLIVLPGGFAYGDYLRCGAMAAQSPIMRDVKRRADEGTAVLGICNGFQVLTETGLLPGAFLRNADLKFVNRPVTLEVEELTPETKDPWGFLRRGATAKTVIDRKDFGLGWNAALETGGVVVGDQVQITIDVELARKA